MKKQKHRKHKQFSKGRTTCKVAELNSNPLGASVLTTRQYYLWVLSPEIGLGKQRWKTSGP